MFVNSSHEQYPQTMHDTMLCIEFVTWKTAHTPCVQSRAVRVVVHSVGHFVARPRRSIVTRLGRPSPKPCCDARAISRHRFKQTLSGQRNPYRDGRPWETCRDKKKKQPSVAIGNSRKSFTTENSLSRHNSSVAPSIVHRAWVVRALMPSYRDIISVSRHKAFRQ